MYVKVVRLGGTMDSMAGWFRYAYLLLVHLQNKSRVACSLAFMRKDKGEPEKWLSWLTRPCLTKFSTNFIRLIWLSASLVTSTLLFDHSLKTQSDSHESTWLCSTLSQASQTSLLKPDPVLTQTHWVLKLQGHFIRRKMRRKFSYFSFYPDRPIQF